MQEDQCSTGRGNIAAPDSRSVARRLLHRGALVGASLVVFAACGSPATATGAASTTATTTTNAPSSSLPAPGAGSSTSQTDRRAAFQAWQSCLTSHGVTLPTFDPNRGGPPSSQPDGSTPPSARGGFGGIGSVLQDPANAAAVSACASLQPQFGGGNGGGGGGGGFGGGGFGRNPATRAAFQAYLACLADNGVTVSTTVAPSSTVPSSSTPSDSSPSSAGPAGRGQPAFDRNDPNFAAANAKCSVLLPARPTPGVTTTVPPSTTGTGG